MFCDLVEKLVVLVEFGCCLVVGCRRGCLVLLVVLDEVLSIFWCCGCVDLSVVVVDMLVVGEMKRLFPVEGWVPEWVWVCCN